MEQIPTEFPLPPMLKRVMYGLARTKFYLWTVKEFLGEERDRQVVANEILMLDNEPKTIHNPRDHSVGVGVMIRLFTMMEQRKRSERTWPSP